jgi:hypothetical protein
MMHSLPHVHVQPGATCMQAPGHQHLDQPTNTGKTWCRRVQAPTIYLQCMGY